VDCDVYIGLVKSVAKNLENWLTPDPRRNIPNNVAAQRLRDYIKDMYQGSVLIIGDPTIKPYDWIYLGDTYEEITGLCEVKTVAHHLSPDTGMVSDFSPDCCCYVAGARTGALWNAAHMVGLGTVTSVLALTGATNALYRLIPVRSAVMDDVVEMWLARNVGEIDEGAEVLEEMRTLRQQWRGGNHAAAAKRGFLAEGVRASYATRLTGRELAEVLVAADEAGLPLISRADDHIVDWLMTAHNAGDPEVLALLERPEAKALKELLEEGLPDALEARAARIGKANLGQGFMNRVKLSIRASVRSLLQKGVVTSFKEFDAVFFAAADEAVDVASEAGRLRAGSLSARMSLSWRSSRGWIREAWMSGLESLHTRAAGTGARAALARAAGAGLPRTASFVSKLGKFAAWGVKAGNPIGAILMTLAQIAGLTSLANYLTRLLYNFQAIVAMPLRKHGRQWSIGIKGHSGMCVGDQLHPLKQLVSPGTTSGTVLELVGGFLSIDMPDYRPPEVDTEGEEAALRALEQSAFSQLRSTRTGEVVQETEVAAGTNALGGGSGASTRYPTAGYVTSDFGPRPAPRPGASTSHKGIDIAAPEGTPIYAMDSGVVIKKNWNTAANGLGIAIRHSGGVVSKYVHMSRNVPGLAVEDAVIQHQIIGYVGMTGGPLTGPHLHFEVEIDGVEVDPTPYVE
jgi:hypothetical protein